MRLLVVTPFLPYPDAPHGSGTYLNTLVCALAERAQLGLVAYVTPQETEARARPNCPLTELVLATRPDSRSLRGMEKTEHLLRMAARWTCSGLPITAAKFRSRGMQDAILEALDRLRPDAVLFEMALAAQYLPLAQDLPTILTDHEAGPPHASGFGPLRLGRSWDAHQWRRYVRRYYQLADLLQAVNQVDAERLSQALGREVVTRPIAVPIPERTVRPGDAGPVLLFFGDYSHGPNPEAARFLANRLLPRIRHVLPEAELHLAGRDPQHRLRRLERRKGVRVLGFVHDLPELLSTARLVVAPVFSGAGSRVKILTALAHGVPVLANALGLRGVDAPTPAAHAEETTAAMATRAIEMLRDPRLAADAGARARAWCEANVSADEVARRQCETIEALLARRS